MRIFLLILLHFAPQVRGAFFEMVCSLCQFTPALAQAEAARLCPAVLLSIDDTDPVVLPPVWEAVLHVVSMIPVSLYSEDDLTFTVILTPSYLGVFLCCLSIDLQYCKKES